ncbi:retropepsin-like aspartic protease [Leptospira koniambonensis]|uniref:retropepsin-like aspartic protease n=1 Tax=Leptospira koniambonensis TaxID=2484950 RepID=UPI003EB8A638
MHPNSQAFTAKSGRLERELYSPILISPSSIYLTPEQRQNPPVTELSAVWDTGAMSTVLTKKVIQTLKIQPISTTRIAGVTGEETCNVYELDLYLPNNTRVQNIQVAEVESLGNHDGLIGMDIIALGDFSVSNVGGKTWFSFIYPPVGTGIDYLQMIKDYNNKLALNGLVTPGGSKKKTSRRH